MSFSVSVRTAKYLQLLVEESPGRFDGKERILTPKDDASAKTFSEIELPKPLVVERLAMVSSYLVWSILMA